METLHALYGPRKPRFLAAAGCDCPPGDGPDQLAAVHLAVRILRLSLGRSFHATGRFLSRRYDGGAPGVQWHKMVIDAELPEHTALTIETATSDLPTAVPTHWDVPRDALGNPVSFRADLPDQLVQSSPGRYLWLRMTLQSNGKATPSVRAVRVFYPRNSPLEFLPSHWQRDEDAQRFLQRFLSLIEHANTGMESAFEAFLRDLHPDAVPKELVDWLGSLVDMSFDPSWPLDRRRALLGSAMELYRLRGTPEGIRRYIEIYTGQVPVVLESFLSRPCRSPFLGVPGLVLGCNMQLCLCAPDKTPDGELYERYAYRFTVVVPVSHPCDAQLMKAVIERIVEINKPAHTVHTVEMVQADAQLGIQDRLDIDFIVGAPASASLQLAGDPDIAPERGGVLGKDSILSDRGTGFLGGTFGTMGGEL